MPDLPAYDGGTVARGAHARFLVALASGGGPLPPGPAPTAAGLERHARRFGPAQVAETAAQYGLSIAIERPRAARKGGGPSLKTRVARLVADGYSVEAIAEVEDLSPARARSLVEGANP